MHGITPNVPLLPQVRKLDPVNGLWSWSHVNDGVAADPIRVPVVWCRDDDVSCEQYDLRSLNHLTHFIMMIMTMTTAMT